MRTLIILSILCFLFACSENKISKVDFLTGTWKMEGKEQYEFWEKSGNKELTGYSYRLNNSQKVITETLTIRIQADKIIYEATVPDQNEGKTIPFILNNEIKEYLSFENSEHDFPKKIQYEKIDNEVIKVTVLGDDDKGFSYKQLKQKLD